MDCVVIGAGVSGLSCAIRLLEAGHSVRVLAREFSPHLVSDQAAAIWYPFLVHPVEKTDRWGAETYTELMRLGEVEPNSGITMRFGREYLREQVELPGWREDITHFRVLQANEIPNGWVFGWEFQSPIIEMQHYMPWLLQRTRELGGIIEQKEVKDLSEISAEIIVNCSGIGARELCSDMEVKPVRGQIIYIEQDPGFGRYDQQPETLTYTIPRRDCTVLGGTAQSDDWSLELRDSDREYILLKCEAVWPELDRSKIIGESVGLRPSRSEVRLEAQKTINGLIIHNYGHGGAGVTLSWGCADEVLRIIQEETEN
ncbi:MAG: FAD-binding oxidoreductase [Candidatus Poseidoniales archaeon]|nr:FAD-binding oxidoreductase [Candidatus Poseidoniales archaeon]